jgi:hypothetical protein
VALVLAVLRVGLTAHGAFAREPRQLLVNMALTGSDGGDLDELGHLASEADRLEAAERYHAAAAALTEWSAAYPAHLAGVRARLGRCHEAQEALGLARRRLELEPDPRGTEEVRLAARWVAHCRAEASTESLPSSSDDEGDAGASRRGEER